MFEPFGERSLPVRINLELLQPVSKLVGICRRRIDCGILNLSFPPSIKAFEGNPVLNTGPTNIHALLVSGFPTKDFGNDAVAPNLDSSELSQQKNT